MPESPRTCGTSFRIPIRALTARSGWLERRTTSRSSTFAIEVEGKFAGGAGVHPFKNEERITAEIGYWLGRPFWGRGIATAVVGALVPWAFDRFPEILRVQACTYDSNLASARVLEKNGFECEGVMRRSVTKGDRILDQHIFARLRET